MLLLLLASVTAVRSEVYIPSETRYDWSGLAGSITSSSKPDIEKARDIYDWITRNIAYDTSLTIRTADETYENKRGVCQGYSELFYRLAEAVGLRTEVIVGKSKDKDGYIDPIGHAWVFAYTNGNAGILMDPTWGAGSVKDGKFTARYDAGWFSVPAEWMIFSHFPDDPVNQLLGSPISFSDFQRLPTLEPHLINYGYDGRELLSASLEGNPPVLPEFYNTKINESASGINVPKEGRLHVGTEYMFALRPVNGQRFVIINGDEWEREWQTDGDVTGIYFTPHSEGELSLSMMNSDNNASTLVEYQVMAPTAAEIAQLEKADPLHSPSLKKLTNFSARRLKDMQVDPQRLLEAVKREGIKSLPEMYPQTGCRPVDVPWNGKLKQGNSYTFIFTPGKGVDFALINNDNWVREWHQDPSTGLISITATPEAGSLKLSAKTDPAANRYQTVLEYVVE